MSIGSLGQRLMVKLVNKLGGLENASRVLGVNQSLLLRFIEGTMAVPDAVLLKAVDQVLDEKPTVAVLPASDLTQKKPLS